MAAERSIIMSFQSPPSAQDMEGVAIEILQSLPDEVQALADALTLAIEEFPDQIVESELELEDSFELLALYRAKPEKIPGVQEKGVNADPVLVLYRRPILDTWCETEDDFGHLLRHIVITELAQAAGFSHDEAEAMSARHHQGLM